MVHDVEGSRQEQRMEATIMRLPNEVLRLILMYALLDPTDFQWAGNRHSTVAIFTEPLLQTCRKLRRTCLDMISQEHLWIELEHSREFRQFDFMGNFKKLPELPAKFQHLLSQDAPRVRLSRHGHCQDKVGVYREPVMALIVFPYNFCSLTFLIHFLSARGGTKLIVDCRNMTLKAEQDYFNFVIPTLSNVHSIESIDFRWEEREVSSPKDFLNPYMTQTCDLDSATEKAIDLLRRADILTTANNSSEASVLLLSSGWLMLESEYLLPEAGTWRELDRDGDLEWHSKGLWVPRWMRGCCPKGNRFRSLLHQIEHRACLGCVQLLTRHGRMWVVNNSKMFHRVELRFNQKRWEHWFGLTATELAEYHYSKALFVYELTSGHVRDLKAVKEPQSFEYQTGRKHEMHIADAVQHVREQSSFVMSETYAAKFAMAHMLFAYRLQPENVHIRQLCEWFRTMLNDPDAELVDNEVHKRLVIVTGLEDVFANISTDVCWAGEQVVFQRDVREFLPYFYLTQKGLDDPNSFQRLVQYYRERGIVA